MLPLRDSNPLVTSDVHRTPFHELISSWLKYLFNSLGQFFEFWMFLLFSFERFFFFNVFQIKKSFIGYVSLKYFLPAVASHFIFSAGIFHREVDYFDEVR